MKKILGIISFIILFLVSCRTDTVSILKIEQTDSIGLVDYYTIYYSDDTTYEFTITNGADGVNGIDGIPGKDGITPKIEIGANGNWIINDRDTNIKAMVEPIIPAIGSDGYWYIGDTNTGYKAIGADGITPTIQIDADGYWVINGEKTNFKANGNIEIFESKLSHLFDIKKGQFILESETLENPTYNYTTSTFSGWTGVIGRADIIDTIAFKVRARDKAISSIKVYLNIDDKNGKKITSDLIHVDILPFEEKEIYWSLDSAYHNLNKDILYFGYACDALCDVYSNFGTNAAFIEKPAIQAYVTNGEQPESLEIFTDVAPKVSRYLYVKLGYMKDIFVPSDNFKEELREKIDVNLADEYYLTVDDNFQLFYRGLIKAVNPYNYYIKIKTNDGHVYPRYYEWKPAMNDLGSHKLTLEVRDDNNNLLGYDTTTLIVNMPKENEDVKNILCIGDSLTAPGIWCYEGYRRFNQAGGNPSGLNLGYLNLIGSVKKEEIGYEGYGGYTWDTFLSVKSPFYNPNTKEIDFKYYLNKIGETKLDYVYIMLTWNGHTKENAEFDFDSKHLKDAMKFIDKIHKDFPNVKIRCMGLQMASQNGGMGNIYKPSSPYGDAYGMLVTAFNYNRALEKMCKLDKYRNFVKYVDVAGQFDTDYNMPSTNKPVNNRNDNTEIIGSNGVHPSNSGYLQMGDIFFRSLVNDFKI